MKNDSSAVLACVGAVIGAGFASGREIIVFFTQFGKHAGWLIALSAGTMAALCYLCMWTAKATGGANWCERMHSSSVQQWCSLLLMIMTAGAMVSASGHMLALLWYHEKAYAIGAVGTLLAAWWIGFGRLRLLSTLSALLTMGLLCALMAALIQQPQQLTLFSEPKGSASELAKAAVWAVGYAAMNMTLAIGVVWRKAQNISRPGTTSGLFGWLIGILLLLSHSVYSQHPEMSASDFPIVALLAGYGRKGYLFSIILLYLSIITTLTSVLFALRTAAEKQTKHWSAQVLLTLGMPIAASSIGFSGIVDRFYAPAGLLCLIVVFLPMLRIGWHHARKSSFS